MARSDPVVFDDKFIIFRDHQWYSRRVSVRATVRRRLGLGWPDLAVQFPGPSTPERNTSPTTAIQAERCQFDVYRASDGIRLFVDLRFRS